MLKSNHEFKSQVNWKNTLYSVLYNLVLVGICLFAVYVVRIGDASFFARFTFFLAWGLLLIFGLIVMGSYFYYLIFRRS